MRSAGCSVRFVAVEEARANDGDDAMLDQLDRHWAEDDAAVTLIGRGGATMPVLPVAHYVLEDHDGYPIACPLCGRVDRWHMEREPGGVMPRGFVCAHLVRTQGGDPVRRVASVANNQIGGYLDLNRLVPTAA
jgi:hypothetical protein